MSFEAVPEQTEDVPGRPIAWMLGMTVLAIVACVFIVWALAAFNVFGGGAAPSHVKLQPPADPFSDPTPVERERGTVDEWQWADRATRRVRVPIDVAIDRYVERKRNTPVEPHASTPVEPHASTPVETRGAR